MPRTDRSYNQSVTRKNVTSVRKLEVVRKSEDIVPPLPPAPAVYVPRGDRQAIVDAFGYGVSLTKLSQRQRRPLSVIESVLREELSELRGKLRTVAVLQSLVIRRAA